MNGKNWNVILSSLPVPHLLQSAQWAEVKSQFGWQPYYLVWQENSGNLEMIENPQGDLPVTNPAAAALILERKIFRGISIMYVPKGPLLKDWTDLRLQKKVLEDLQYFAQKRGAIQIKIDPDLVIGHGIPGEDEPDIDPQGIDIRKEWMEQGWRFSSDQIQFRNTILIDLRQDDIEILGRMKSKTRYNIRLAERKGITIRLGDKTDLAGLYRMYADTSMRGGFTIRGESYYQTLWQIFMREGLHKKTDPVAQPIIAEFEEQPVAGAVMFRFGERAWYLHGMSLPEHNEKMPSYLIQWEGMRWAKENGCSTYDMWGAPDRFVDTDSMWGVYRFKRGFGGEVVRTIGAWDYAAKPQLYKIYTRVMPMILNSMRRVGDRNTERIHRNT